MGLPVVATHHGGIVEAVRDGETGFLVGERDVSALVEALDCLILDRERRLEMGRAARALVERDFNLGSQVAEHLEIYESLSPAAARGQAARAHLDPRELSGARAPHHPQPRRVLGGRAAGALHLGAPHGDALPRAGAAREPPRAPLRPQEVRAADGQVPGEADGRAHPRLGDRGPLPLALRRQPRHPREHGPAGAELLPRGRRDVRRERAVGPHRGDAAAAIPRSSRSRRTRTPSPSTPGAPGRPDSGRDGARRSRLERGGEHLVDGVDEAHVELLAHLGGHLDEVLLVAPRQDHALDAGARRPRAPSP